MPGPSLPILTLSRAWLAPIWLSFFCSDKHSNTTLTTGALLLPGTSQPYSRVNPWAYEANASQVASRTTPSVSCSAKLSSHMLLKNMASS